MKFGKGTIKNINKKLIAGTLAMTLVMVPMSDVLMNNILNSNIVLMNKESILTLAFYFILQ